jgi:hypothetical protein
MIVMIMMVMSVVVVAIKLSRDGVTIDRFRIDGRIYCTLTTHNYK